LEKLPVLQVVDPDDGQIRHRFLRLFDEASYAATIDDGDPESTRILDRLDEEQAVGVGAREGCQVGLDDGVDEDDQDRLINCVGRKIQGVCLTAQLFLLDETRGKIVTRANVLFDLPAEVSDDVDHLVDRQLFELIEDVRQHRLPGNLDEGLWFGVSVWT